MRRTLHSASALSFTLLAGLVTPALAQTPAQPVSVVVASGESRLKVAPDQAWVLVAVESRDTKGPEALRLGAVAMTSVMARPNGTCMGMARMFSGIRTYNRNFSMKR